MKHRFLDISKELLNQDYVLTEHNIAVINGLMKYFTGNGDIDLNKGIYLYGKYGTGKTEIFRILQKVLANLFPFSPNGFMITSIEMIIDEYKKKKNSLDKYGYNDNDVPLSLCINEFGKKINEKIYGTEAESVIESLFMIRYELFKNGKLTHVTSNYIPDELDLSPIIKDRMVEMFNFIELKGESFRK